jgi:hypothetical protein
MNRRKLLATLGLLSGGGAIVTGTGAFGYLSIDDTGNANADYVTDDSGSSSSEFGLDFTGENDTVSGGGVNADAVTVFEDLFEVRNQGTQGVEVQVTPLAFVESSGGDTTLVVLVVPDSSFPTVEIQTGRKETYSMIVAATESVETGDQLSDTITISGEAV